MTSSETTSVNPPNQEEAFFGVLGGIANHEAKLAVTGIITSNPDRWFGDGDLFREVKNVQGESPGWIPNHRQPMRYCINSLAPIGLVAKGAVASDRGEMTAFKANDDMPEIVLLGQAFSGILMEWSLDFPDTSVQPALGVTALKGKFRTPELRYKLFKSLLENTADEVSYMDIVTDIEDDSIGRQAVYGNIRELARKGLLATHVLDVANDVTLEIVDPELRHPGWKVEDLSHESQLVYGAMARLWQAGKRQIQFNDMTREALILDPDLDVQVLRQFWNWGSNDKAENMPGLKLFSRKIDDPTKLTTVATVPEHHDALAALVTRLDTIRGASALTLKDYAALAKNIVSTPDYMSALFAKAHRFSSAAAGQATDTAATADKIVSLLSDGDDLTVKQIHGQLAEGGSHLTLESVRQYLNKLSAQGLLNTETRRPDPTKKRAISFFSIVNQQL